MQDIHNLLLLGPEFLEFSEVYEAHEKNKSKILEFIKAFQEANGNRNDFYLLGSSALILQDAIYKKNVRDIDIHTNGENFIPTDRIDFISGFLLPEGWQDRAKVINGVNVVSKHDIICSMAGSSLAKEKQIEAKAMLKILLPKEDVNIIKQNLETMLIKNKSKTSDIRYELYTNAYNEFIKLCEENAFDGNPQIVLYNAMKEIE